MKDSNIGAIGLQAELIIILLQISALIKLGSFAIFAFPIANFWSRIAPLWAINQFPYLHEATCASFHKKNWKGFNEFIPSIITILFFTLAINNFVINYSYKYQILALIYLCILPTIIVPSIIGKILKGHSGDSYGASLIIVETIILLIMALFLKAIQ